MRITCVCCGKQVLFEKVNPNDKYVTTGIGARAAFSASECYCGHCAEDLDENGMFPEERALLCNY